MDEDNLRHQIEEQQAALTRCLGHAWEDDEDNQEIVLVLARTVAIFDGQTSLKVTQDEQAKDLESREGAVTAREVAVADRENLITCRERLASSYDADLRAREGSLAVSLNQLNLQLTDLEQRETEVAAANAAAEQRIAEKETAAEQRIAAKETASEEAEAAAKERIIAAEVAEQGLQTTEDALIAAMGCRNLETLGTHMVRLNLVGSVEMSQQKIKTEHAMMLMALTKSAQSPGSSHKKSKRTRSDGGQRATVDEDAFNEARATSARDTWMRRSNVSSSISARPRPMSSLQSPGSAPTSNAASSRLPDLGREMDSLALGTPDANARTYPARNVPGLGVPDPSYQARNNPASNVPGMGIPGASNNTTPTTAATVAPAVALAGWRARAKNVETTITLRQVLQVLSILDPLTGDIIGAATMNVNFTDDDLVDIRTTAGNRSLMSGVAGTKCLVARARKSAPADVDSNAIVAYGVQRVILPLPVDLREGVTSSDRGMYVRAPFKPAA